MEMKIKTKFSPEDEIYRVAPDTDDSFAVYGPKRIYSIHISRHGIAYLTSGGSELKESECFADQASAQKAADHKTNEAILARIAELREKMR